MAQLPRRMGKCQKRMRFGAHQRRMSAESRADFSGRTGRHTSAEDTAIATPSSVDGGAFAVDSAASASIPGAHAAIARAAPSSAIWSRFRRDILPVQAEGFGDRSIKRSGRCGNGRRGRRRSSHYRGTD